MTAPIPINSAHLLIPVLPCSYLLPATWRGKAKQLDQGIARYFGIAISGAFPTRGNPSIMREETFASAVDVGYGCGNPNINHD
jgi:hypothetical protein